MQPFIIALIVSAVAGAIGCAVWWDYYTNKKRTEALRGLAEELGFSFEPKSDNSLLSQFGGFHLFTQGHGKKVQNLMQSDASDVRAAVFDYRYTVGSGKHQQTYKQTVLYFQTNELALPHFVLRPESFWHKIGKLFGYQDIDFEANPTFSKHYLLRGQR
jgi:hypothetical protein